MRTAFAKRDQADASADSKGLATRDDDRVRDSAAGRREDAFEVATLADDDFDDDSDDDLDDADLDGDLDDDLDDDSDERDVDDVGRRRGDEGAPARSRDDAAP